MVQASTAWGSVGFPAFLCRVPGTPLPSPTAESSQESARGPQGSVLPNGTAGEVRSRPRAAAPKLHWKIRSSLSSRLSASLTPSTS